MEKALSDYQHIQAVHPTPDRSHSETEGTLETREGHCSPPLRMPREACTIHAKAFTVMKEGVTWDSLIFKRQSGTADRRV